jgi:type 1 glutamine amidotransferase
MERSSKRDRGNRSRGGKVGKANFLAAAPLIILLASPRAYASGLRDCPVAGTAFSSAGPLVDILRSDAAKAVLERDAPEVVRILPPALRNTTSPTIAAVVSADAVSKRLHVPLDRATLNRDLARIEISPRDKVMRCAHYDVATSTLPTPGRHPALLVFDKTSGARDPASIAGAAGLLTRLAERNHWSITFTSNGGAITGRQLRHYDAVVWNNVSGDVLTLSQRAALKAYVVNGGGFVGLHGAGGDYVYPWAWYADVLIGARFIGHPLKPQFQAANVGVDDMASPITRGLGPGWSTTEEWYSFARSPRLSGAHILLTLDEASYDPDEDLRMGDHPIAWTRCVGRGRSFYDAMGHRPETYSEPHQMALIEGGVRWAMSRRSRCRNTP